MDFDKVELNKLIHFSNWLTPENVYYRRYDTHFFLYAYASNNEQCFIDNNEVVDYSWLTPLEALKLFKEGGIDLYPPQFYMLFQLSRFTDASSLIEHFKTRQGSVLPFLPLLVGTKFKDVRVSLLPGDYLYNSQTKIIHLDPDKGRLDSNIYLNSDKGVLNRLLITMGKSGIKKMELHQTQSKL